MQEQPPPLRPRRKIEVICTTVGEVFDRLREVGVEPTPANIDHACHYIAMCARAGADQAMDDLGAEFDRRDREGGS